MNVFTPVLWLFSSFPLYCILSSLFLRSVQIGLFVLLCCVVLCAILYYKSLYNGCATLVCGVHVLGYSLCKGL